MARKFSNTFAQTTLTGSISNSATTITIGSTAGLPASFPYTLALDYGTASVEMVNVTALAGANLTVTRGQDGTSAQSHTAGAVVVHPVSARDLSEPQVHIDASTDIHGLASGAAVVGTTSTQTLTNKTISGAANTLSNIPSSAITALAASKVSQPFDSLTAVGSAGGSQVMTVTGDEVSRTVPVASWKRGGIGLLVDEDAVVDVSSDLSVGTARPHLAAALTARLYVLATTKIGVLVQRVAANVQDLFQVVTEGGVNLFKVASTGAVTSASSITAGTSLNGATLATTGAATVGTTLGVTGLLTASAGAAVTGAITATTTITATTAVNGVTDVQYNGSSLPRGIIGGTRYTGTTDRANTIGTTRAVANMDTGAVALEAGRIYHVRARFKLAGTVNNDVFSVEMRDTDVNGTLRAFMTWHNPSTFFGYPLDMTGEYVTTGAETKTFLLAGQRISGTGTLAFQNASTGGDLFIEVVDMGPSSKITTV